MKTKTSAGGMAGCHLGFHPKMRMNRIRTCSSDSGCDMVSEHGGGGGSSKIWFSEFCKC